MKWPRSCVKRVLLERVLNMLEEMLCLNSVPCRRAPLHPWFCRSLRFGSGGDNSGDLRVPLFDFHAIQRPSFRRIVFSTQHMHSAPFRALGMIVLTDDQVSGLFCSLLLVMSKNDRVK